MTGLENIVNINDNLLKKDKSVPVIEKLHVNLSACFKLYKNGLNFQQTS